jgi:hypothetical protein
MKIGHIHARRNGAGALRFGRQVIDIFNFQCIAWETRRIGATSWPL